MKTSTTKLAMALLVLSGCTERTHQQAPAESALNQGRTGADRVAAAAQAQPSVGTKQVATVEAAKGKAPTRPAARSHPTLRAKGTQQTAGIPGKAAATQEPAKTKALLSTANDSWAVRQR